MQDQKRTFVTRRASVEAYKVSERNIAAVAEWCNGNVGVNRVYVGDKNEERYPPMIELESSIGWSVATPGDYVVKFPGRNLFDVMTATQFELLFELASWERDRDGDMWPEQEQCRDVSNDPKS